MPPCRDRWRPVRFAGFQIDFRETFQFFDGARNRRLLIRNIQLGDLAALHLASICDAERHFELAVG